MLLTEKCFCITFTCYVFTCLQASVSQFAVPHVGDTSAGSRDRFSGTQRYSFHPWSPGVSSAAGTVFPSQDSIQESIHTSGKLRDHSHEDRGQVSQGLWSTREMWLCQILIKFQLNHNMAVIVLYRSSVTRLNHRCPSRTTFVGGRFELSGMLCGTEVRCNFWNCPATPLHYLQKVATYLSIVPEPADVLWEQ
jgi:hypothetical protein